MTRPTVSPRELRAGITKGLIDRRGVAKVLASAGIASATMMGIAR